MSSEGRPFGLPSFEQLERILGQICHAWAFSVEVFLHGGFGRRYIGVQSAVVLLLVPAFVLFWEGDGQQHRTVPNPVATSARARAPARPRGPIAAAPASIRLPHDATPLLWFLVAYVVMCVWARLTMLVRGRRGIHVHTLYTGYPRLLAIVRFAPEVFTKLIIEPFGVMALGLTLVSSSAPLGVYLSIAGLLLFGKVHREEEWMRHQTSDMHDAVIDQEMIAERFRSERGDEW